jgi:hypothetical protein
VIRVKEVLWNDFESGPRVIETLKRIGNPIKRMEAAVKENKRVLSKLNSGVEGRPSHAMR